jgi:type IV pilus assembly protein PilM
MAAVSDTVWAIDLGSNSLKALRLTNVGGVVQVIGFDHIQHGKILSGSGVKPAERDELIALSLRQFVQRNDLGGDEIIISVPSQNSFARFVNLPPVEPKRIPEIVRFEAVQQIPFDINEVEWDWQLMTEADSPEKKVGIFAIKREAVNSSMEHFEREDLRVSYIQMAPMALYNYIMYDHAELLSSNNQAVVVLNVGAENTDLVVCTKSMVWQRCILIGGNTFTKAISDAFKLSFEKAEKLKRTAPVSKYARQILQAMKPVFTDLVSEVQRSLGFYSTSNPNAKFVKVIALGGGTKLRGLLKYLQQSLQLPVERPDSFKKLAMSQRVSAAKFHENVSDFGVVYGLAIQGLGLAAISGNLLPKSVARSMAWASKGRYFAAAACLLLLVSLMTLARTGLDKINYAKNDRIRSEIGDVLDDAKNARNQLQEQQRMGSELQDKIKKYFEPFKYREVIPLLHETILSVLPNAENNPAQKELYEAFANGDVETIKLTPRKERKQLFITSMSAYYSNDLDRAQFGATALMRKGAMGLDQRGEGMEGYFMDDPRMMDPLMQSRYAPDLTYGGQEQVEKSAGFVVTIAGYSPYKDIGELLDPPGVGDRRDRWGFVTRLQRLDEIVDGNCPFKLYEKGSKEHYKLDKDPVDLSADVPAGIGILDVIPGMGSQIAAPGRGSSIDIGGRDVLRDPMTKEIISKVPVLDEYGREKIDRRTGSPMYEDNDYWFVLNFKVVWEDAPKPPEPAAGAMSPYGTAPVRPPVSSPSSSSSRSTKGLGGGKFDF